MSAAEDERAVAEVLERVLPGALEWDWEEGDGVPSVADCLAPVIADVAEQIAPLLATVRTEERARIAAAIEALPVMRTPGGRQYRERRSPSTMRADAARIAAGGGVE